MNIDIELLRERLYASSPHDLGSDEDNIYTDEQFIRIGEKAGEYVMENWWDALGELCKDVKPLEDSIPL